MALKNNVKQETIFTNNLDLKKRPLQKRGLMWRVTATNFYFSEFVRCADTISVTQCRHLRRHHACTTHMERMKKLCPDTCGLCPSVNRPGTFVCISWKHPYIIMHYRGVQRFAVLCAFSWVLDNFLRGFSAVLRFSGTPLDPPRHYSLQPKRLDIFPWDGQFLLGVDKWRAHDRMSRGHSKSISLA